MKTFNLLWVFIFLSLVSCQQPTVTSTLQPTVDISVVQTKAVRDVFATMTANIPTLTPTLNNPDLLYSDDFSSITSGWAIADDINGTRRYFNGQYSMKAKTDQFLFIDTIKNQNFSDAVIYLDVRMVSGNNKKSFANIIWRSVDDDNFYLLSFSDNGYYAFYKCFEGKYNNISGTIYNPEFNHAGEVNKVALAIHGNKHEIFVNDKYVATYVDNTFESGEIGFGVNTLVGSEDQPEFVFDNFYIYKYDITNAYTPLVPN